MAGLYGFCGGHTLINVFKHLVTSGLGTDIDHFKAVFTKLAQLLMALAQHILGSAVDGDTLGLGENLINLVKNGDYILGLYN